MMKLIWQSPFEKTATRIRFEKVWFTAFFVLTRQCRLGPFMRKRVFFHWTVGINNFKLIRIPYELEPVLFVFHDDGRKYVSINAKQ